MNQNQNQDPTVSNSSSKLEALDALKQLERILKKTGSEADQVISPVRQTILKRYPVVSVMLVTFGVGATFFGLERIITETAYLNDRPWLIFGLGIAILTLTGKLYKKLG